MQTKFTRFLLDKSNKCEACSVADFDNDGKLEILCGEYLYYGDNFSQKRKVCEINYDGNYVWDFSDYPMDINGDGLPDIVTGSWWDDGLYWRENSGGEGLWKSHKIGDTSNVETIRFYDIDGDGIPEIFANTPNEPQSIFKLVTDESGKGTGKFEKYIISADISGHGLGFGDINGDGKTDVLLWNGWLEQPEDIYAGVWEFHPYGFEVPMACVPILCEDINGDGLNDIIIGAGHNFGLWWYEQVLTDGVRSFVKHDIDLENSQYHDMQLYDIDGDGKLELITGARHFAHNGNDPGELNPFGFYIFDIENGEFKKNTLNFGKPEDTSGTGIYFWLEDLTGNGLKDIVAPGKEGLYIFYNER